MASALVEAFKRFHWYVAILLEAESRNIRPMLTPDKEELILGTCP